VCDGRLSLAEAEQQERERQAHNANLKPITFTARMMPR
jgi:hypothetical protein